MEAVRCEAAGGKDEIGSAKCLLAKERQRGPDLNPVGGDDTGCGWREDSYNRGSRGEERMSGENQARARRSSGEKSGEELKAIAGKAAEEEASATDGEFVNACRIVEAEEAVRNTLAIGHPS